ncbi:MAG: Phosphatidylinositol alpha-mannosyltransferase [Solirubrobacterales bacterium]|nr:Phosphatidylinositol alpha-mannosyltransferase [Solirubrobacterales bacterium]
MTRHIEALAGQFLRDGHEVRVLAPFDPPDRRAARTHRGHAPEPREAPDYLRSLGRTIGFPANGAVSNCAPPAAALSELRRALQEERYDVVHVHEPVAPVVGWDVLATSPAPLVGTFHCYSDSRLSNNVAVFLGARRRLNHLKARIAVSEAAAWTGRRFYGGQYRIIPNGVEVAGTPEEIIALRPRRSAADPTLRLLFVGQAVERKGLPILLRAFEALRVQVPATLTIIGSTPEDVAQVLEDPTGVRALGRVDDATKQRELRLADALCAPSLGGESFGMVLTEAFAAGTPVVASDIAGYRDVVRNGTDGLLVPRADATALAEALRDLALRPERHEAMGREAALSAQRYAWPHVAAEVMDTYERAIAVGEPVTVPHRLAVKVGALPADLEPRRPPVRLPSLEPALPGSHPRRSLARKVALGLAGAGATVGAVVALNRIGLDRITDSLVTSSPPWVLLALGIMCLSMAVRAVAWHAILRAALPHAHVKRRDAFQGTTIGVLMSATLPARLGEPARAMIVARRVGRPRETLPVVLGTLVSQTILNIVALLVLGVTMFATSSYFDGHHGDLALFAAAPIAVLLLVVAAPMVLRGARPWGWVRKVRAALHSVRAGLTVFRRPRLGATATFAQLFAWVLQWLSCYVLLVAFGVDETAGLGAAAAVLFAVNVTAVLPATPSNLGVFQAACVAVLSGAYGVSAADALGYGIVLQVVEIATAVLMGAPALVKEGLSWKDVRLRTMHYAPVELSPLPGGPSQGHPA